MSAATNLKVAAQEMADAAPDIEWRVSHESLASALVHALSELTVIEKGRTANAGSYSYDYADLGDIVKHTRPVLARHGLTVLTPLHAHGNELACSVVIFHESGQREDFGPFPFPHGRDAQATGSMVTYHRRYALLAALGMATGEDDDGAAAVPRQAPAQVPGFRASLMAATENLTEVERGLLRDWLKEEGLPDRPSKMNAEQADRVCEWLLHGMPKPDPAGSVPSENQADPA